MVAKPGFRLLMVCWLVLIAGQMARADEPLASRQEQIEDMDLVQMEQLLQRHKQFHAFKPEERERCRSLDRAIENDPDGDELRRVLDRYYDWLKTLSSYQLMELRKLSPEERIERIKTLQQEQGLQERRRSGFRRFGPGFDGFGNMPEQISPDDKRVLLEWTAEYAAGHEDAFTESLPGPMREKLRRELAQVGDPGARMQVLFWRMWLRRQLDAPKKPIPDINDDWPRLVASLSAKMRENLEALPKDEQHARIVGAIRMFALEHYFAHRPGPVPSVISDKELAGYFANELDERQRSWFLSLPSGDMRRMVWRFYLMKKLPGMPKGFPPMGPGDARGPGSERHGPYQRGGGERPDPGRAGPPPGGRKGPEAPFPHPMGEPRNRTGKATRGNGPAGERN